MPRQLSTQYESATLEDINEALSYIEDKSLRVAFNETHLDIVVDFVNETFISDPQDMVTRDDMMDLMYASLMTDGKYARCLPVIEALNHYQDPIDKQDFISKEIKRKTGSKQETAIMTGLSLSLVPAMIASTAVLFLTGSIALGLVGGIYSAVMITTIASKLSKARTNVNKLEKQAEVNFERAQFNWREQHLDHLKQITQERMETVEGSSYPVRFKEMKMPKLEATL